jgi:coenzyme Q-binding protein COQ10
MQTYFKQVDLPYTPQQVFDLVADVESYPRFLPHVASARISRRNGNNLWVEQLVRIKMLRLRFRTRAVLEPWSRIRVVCGDSPFGAFSEQWTFAAGPRGGTRLQCRAEFAFSSGLLGRMLTGAMGEALDATVKAFELRAARLYGHAAAVS